MWEALERNETCQYSRFLCSSPSPPLNICNYFLTRLSRTSTLITSLQQSQGELLVNPKTGDDVDCGVRCEVGAQFPRSEVPVWHLSSSLQAPHCGQSGVLSPLLTDEPLTSPGHSLGQPDNRKWFSNKFPTFLRRTMLKSNIFLFVVTYLASPGKTDTDLTEEFRIFPHFFWQRAIFLLSSIPCFYLPDHHHYLANWNRQKTGFFAFSKYLTCYCTDLPADSMSDQSKIISFINQLIKR